MLAAHGRSVYALLPWRRLAAAALTAAFCTGCHLAPGCKDCAVSADPATASGHLTEASASGYPAVSATASDGASQDSAHRRSSVSATPVSVSPVSSDYANRPSQVEQPAAVSMPPAGKYSANLFRSDGSPSACST